MFTAYVVVTFMAIAANAFSGVAALVHWKRILPGMAGAGVPESWLTTLDTLKTAGAIGLLLGLVGAAFIGTAAATGLVLFFVGAVVAHLRARLFAAVRSGGRVLPADRSHACVRLGFLSRERCLPSIRPPSGTGGSRKFVGKVPKTWPPGIYPFGWPCPTLGKRAGAGVLCLFYPPPP